MVTPWILAPFMALAGVSGTVGATTLTVAQLAKHDHSIDTAHMGWGTAAGGNAAVYTSYKSGAAGSSASHTHSLSGVKSGSASSLPPYYALAYIMRVA